MHDLVPYNLKSTRTLLECKEISILEWQGNSPDMNPIKTVWNIMKTETSNQMPCKKEKMWKRVCEVWYSVPPNVLEQLYISMPKNWQREVQRNTDFMM